MSNREEFQANRDAGLAIRQQRRIETRAELRRRTRREVAEEIAAAIEAHYIPVTNVGGADPIPSDPTEWDEALHEAVTIAREIGTR